MKKIIISIVFLSGLCSCKKYLDAKSSKDLVIPSTFADAQALLDLYTKMNTFYPSAGCISDDDLYLGDTYLASITTNLQYQYSWNKDVNLDADWNNLYAVVLWANVALETVEGITPLPANLQEWQRLKGSALFFRAYAFYQLAEFFATPYNKATASGKPGIPLRLSSDPNVPNTRASLESSYRQIIDDLRAAAINLPVSVTPITRPSKPAAYAVMARVYLAMQEYSLAGKYADSSLQLYSSLLNYNTLDPNAAMPFTRFNAEVLFATSVIGGPLSVNNWRADTLLYDSYGANDLRKKLFFKTNGSGASVSYGFKGNYDGSAPGLTFSGPAVDEMYLIRAECLAREGNVPAAMNDLNTLLITRWKTGTFVPFTASTAEDALIKVLAERRKELIVRGTRWFDLRRLNSDSRFAKTLVRKINGVVSQLPPNDPRYTFYIPAMVVAMSGIEQNDR